MEGVMGEAEKEGKGDEVRARVEEFKKQSKLKGLATISFFIVAVFYYKLGYVPPITPSGL
jgi:DNA-directed RNA polymerase beta' subunit